MLVSDWYLVWADTQNIFPKLTELSQFQPLWTDVELNIPQTSGSALNQTVLLTVKSSLCNSHGMTGRAIGLLFWPCPGITAAFCVQLTAVSAGFGNFLTHSCENNLVMFYPWAAYPLFMHVRTHKWRWARVPRWLRCRLWSVLLFHLTEFISVQTRRKTEFYLKKNIVSQGKCSSLWPQLSTSDFFVFSYCYLVLVYLTYHWTLDVNAQHYMYSSITENQTSIKTKSLL